MSSVVISGDTSGAITLSAPAVAGTNTLTLPASTGTVMVNGPAFSAYLGSAQALTSNTWTKLQCNTEEFDTNSNYDNSTNYRFTPTVSGYYQVSGCMNLTTNNNAYITIYKNGSSFKKGNFITNSSGYAASVSALIYFNGSTDYVELYGQTATNQNASSGADNTYFQAAMVRNT